MTPATEGSVSVSSGQLLPNGQSAASNADRPQHRGGPVRGLVRSDPGDNTPPTIGRGVPDPGIVLSLHFGAAALPKQ
jgi:hypothetical protein